MGFHYRTVCLLIISIEYYDVFLIINYYAFHLTQMTTVGYGERIFKRTDFLLSYSLIKISILGVISPVDLNPNILLNKIQNLIL